MVLSIFIDNYEWKVLVQFLKSHAFFMKWNGEWLTYSSIRVWVDTKWGEACVLKTLPNGFYLVISSNEHDKEWILNSGPFLIRRKGFFIKDWRPNFDPKKEEIDLVPLWIHLYNLPHEYWNIETLKLIGDKLGGFLKADEAVDVVEYNMYAKICMQ